MLRTDSLRRRVRSQRRRPHLEALESRELLATFMVTTASDSGPGSLRQAILDANASAGPGPNVVQFSIGTGPQTIGVATSLPTITSTGLTIDGTTQPGFSGTPLITLNGASAGSSANGLVLGAGDDAVLDLAINGFGGDGILLNGAGATHDLVAGNNIGTNASGTTALANGDGVVLNGATGNTLGGTTAGARNVISGNTRYGIDLGGTATTGNLVEGNLVGLTAAGSSALGNAVGVFIEGPNNTVGGLTAAARNVISGNRGNGLQIDLAAATGNLVEGNFIGTDTTGAVGLGNLSIGVFIHNASSNTVGGSVAGAGNVISGNVSSGVQIAPAVGMVLTTGDTVQGNLIGTDASGSRAIGNAGSGVSIQNAQGTTVGGTTAGARNVISGNGNSGISISGPAAAFNAVQGNYVGTDVTGAMPVGNTFDGVSLAGPSNTVGGTAAGAGNVISGNGASGVALNGPMAMSNAVLGNRIGTNATGSGALGNTFDGVVITSAPSNSIGAPGAGGGNVISGNGDNGIDLRGPGSSGNVIVGNLIGTDATGGNPLGNVGSGILLQLGASSNSIGNPTTSAGNQISANLGAGVFLRGSTVTNNFVGGNTLGGRTRRERRLGNVVGLARLNSFGNRIGRNLIQANRRNNLSARGFLSF
jgi:titin